MDGKWQRKVDALILLAEDQKGKPEGDVAREKLLLILNNHPEAVRYQPLVDMAYRDISTQDVVRMHKMGISTDGVWEGATLWEAMDNMMKDYTARAFGVPQEFFYGRSPLEQTREVLEAYGLFKDFLRRSHVDEPSTDPNLNTPSEAVEDHKEPPTPRDIDDLA